MLGRDILKDKILLSENLEILRIAYYDWCVLS